MLEISAIEAIPDAAGGRIQAWVLVDELRRVAKLDRPNVAAYCTVIPRSACNEAAAIIEALSAEVARLQSKIDSIHKSLDLADQQRSKSRNYAELAVSNGLALGQIAVMLGHDFDKQALPESPEGVERDA